MKLLSRHPGLITPDGTQGADPDKDPWTGTQVSHAYGDHTLTVAKNGLGIEPASRARWMAVKGLEAAEVENDWQRYRVVDRRCECENCKGEGPVGASGCIG
jgi:hypothetical protein